MRQLANRRRTQQKKDGDPCFIPEIIQQLCRNHNYLVARPSVHRGEARAGVALLSRRKKVLNRGSYSVVEALASLGSDFVLDEELVALDSQGRPSFWLLQSTIPQLLPIYVTHSIY